MKIPLLLGLALGLAGALAVPVEVEDIEERLRALQQSEEEAEPSERQRRAAARTRTQSALCAVGNGTTDTGNSVGCVAASLLPADKTFEIRFREPTGTSKLSASTCFNACRLFFPEASVAFVRGDEKSALLTCSCGLAHSVHADVLGPDVFCADECVGGEICGGEHEFVDGGKEIYLSVYCVPPEDNVTASDLPSERTSSGDNITTTTTESAPTSPEDDYFNEENDNEGQSVEELLNEIWLTLMRANIVNIVLIGLFVLLIILVLVLFVWTYMFMESFDPSSSSRFYRRMSGDKKPILNKDSKEDGYNGHSAGYGATNRVFDPTPDSDQPQDIFVDSKRKDQDADAKSVGRSSFYGMRNRDADTFSHDSVETEPADDSEEVRKEAKSSK